MTKFPSRLQDRLAITVASTKRLADTAHQRLNSIGSQVSALVPGDWQPVTLTAGWTSLPGYIPAQVRIQQTGLALLAGHITGGLTTTGTVIGTLPGGYYSPTWSQAVGVTVMAGASAASYNTTVITVNTLGLLVLTNCPAAATQLSFCEHLPLA